jgi:hypothetical protein
MAPTTPEPEAITIAGTVDRMTRAGYTDWFRAEAGGLRAAKAGCVHPPQAMRVDEIARFEGETNPSDEAIVFALECKQDGVKGTFTVPYGKDTPAADVEAVRLLQIEAARRSA